MIDIGTVVLILLAGLVLGGFFFGGLLWTVERGLLAKHPAFWFLGSWLVRITVVVLGFYLVSAGRWERLLICLAGLLIARLVLIRFTGTAKKTNALRKEAGDAS